ncbi:MAG TPA: DegT/DnrJ/EryC1/StrS family aminotransferase [Acidobacteriaceae bacterium]|nr:DegT/DnrJ/EryC1/StrS family aminotransferase [Acidobacteriaceae bacterium]
MLDLSRQFARLRGEILEAIGEVCDSQHYILGPKVAEFEAAAAAMCGTRFAAGCTSGTDALWLALAAAGTGDSTQVARLEPQPAVITTPFTFFATASAILRAGARPVFADIDPRTFNLSADAVDQVLRADTERRVAAILPVHLYGQCAEMNRFYALGQESEGLAIVEDAAQAFGATWKCDDGVVRTAGAFGVTAAFSFYPTKNLSAFGEAGLVTTMDEAVDARVRSLRSHGMTRRYHHDEVGWNCRMDAVQAAVLGVKLKYIADWNEQRRERAARYDELFRAAGIAAPEGSTSTKDGMVLPFTDERATHVFHQYVVRVERRDALREHLAAKGIGSEVYYPVPLHEQDALRGLGYKAGDFPEAERAAKEVLALPIFPELRDDEQERVVEAVREFYV